MTGTLQGSAGPGTLQPADDGQDRRDAERGFIAALEPGQVTDANGRVVYDAEAYSFLEEAPPATAHSGLWGQGRLVSRQGLFHVAEGIYQVRGLDLANLTLVEGDEGVIVIDALTSAECADAALRLYQAHRGVRPVTAVILTHPHADHFGGIDGVLAHAVPRVPVVAPEGFLEHAVSENVLVGPAMGRRAGFMYGHRLEASPTGHIGCGLGQRLSTGASALAEPTDTIRETGEVRVLDGVEIEFQLTPETEAPAEMNLYLPASRALCMAENAVHTMHNIVTLRGAQVRDARQWARYLTETLERYGSRAEVAFATHHWPTWGAGPVQAFLAGQRDMYAYLHDQTVRLINRGLTAREIAEELVLPPDLEALGANRGYYGSLSHNVKGIYQRYLGWFDGNPAHLWEHPPAEEGRRWVQLLGGTEAALAHARELLGQGGEGDVRFAATLLGHVVFADPDSPQARSLLAQAFTSLAYGCENATWRNFYLTGAKELLDGPPPARPPRQKLVGALPVEQILDSLTVRVDGPRAWDLDLSIDWHVTDEGALHRLRLFRGVLLHRQGSAADGGAQLALRTTRKQLLAVLATGSLEGIDFEGDPAVLSTLLQVLEAPDPAFPIVTP
ncbi:alkyl sulfatase [Sinomonas atrocyanea]|uniref:Alkyl sulfatase n=1 Tax=Sinomonas atrocyanea TaxID=37927 RepID=A0A127A0I1_9MICC|nr:alkyl sulfatase dimerization domain-containing protein [Sinomonas atrocyanea]AMM32919.1 alkyl sulfatase [Sinomonas atrocyanea]GEB65040.1 alkyl sulfatase [Sinomonas atrocyanea]GGG61277.1 alkyl sulfatase [Sinomonas atrocyanea]